MDVILTTTVGPTVWIIKTKLDEEIDDDLKAGETIKTGVLEFEVEGLTQMGDPPTYQVKPVRKDITRDEMRKAGWKDEITP